MADDDDAVRNLALAVLAAVVALIVALSITLASIAMRKHTALPMTLNATMYFAQGSDKLNAHASEVLKRIRESARRNSRSIVRIYSVEPLREESEQNPRLAYLRALAVRHGLENLGLPPDRMSVQPPMQAERGTDARSARRVELRLE